MPPHLIYFLKLFFITSLCRWGRDLFFHVYQNGSFEEGTPCWKERESEHDIVREEKQEKAAPKGQVHGPNVEHPREVEPQNDPQKQPKEPRPSLRYKLGH